MRKLNGIFSAENGYLCKAVRRALSLKGNYINWLDMEDVHKADFILTTEVELQRERWQTASIEELQLLLSKTFILSNGYQVENNHNWPKYLDISLGADSNFKEILKYVDYDNYESWRHNYPASIPAIAVYNQWNHKFARDVAFALIKKLNELVCANTLVVDLTEFISYEDRFNVSLYDQQRIDNMGKELGTFQLGVGGAGKKVFQSCEDGENVDFLWKKMIYSSLENKEFPILSLANSFDGGYELVRNAYFLQGSWMDIDFYQWLRKQCEREDFSHLVLIVGGISSWAIGALAEAERIIIVEGEDANEVDFRKKQLLTMFENKIPLNRNGGAYNLKDENILTEKEKCKFNLADDEGYGLWLLKTGDAIDAVYSKALQEQEFIEEKEHNLLDAHRNLNEGPWMDIILQWLEHIGQKGQYV